MILAQGFQLHSSMAARNGRVLSEDEYYLVLLLV
jgi:hypothetical protein